MLDQIRLEKIIFIDIETVPLFPNYELLSDKWKSLWDKKAGYIAKEDQTSVELYERAGIYAEFGKIVCISLGIIREVEGKRTFRVKSL